MQSPVKQAQVSVQNIESGNKDRKSQRRRRANEDLECNEELQPAKTEEKAQSTNYL
jgi:hypothetical protein